MKRWLNVLAIIPIVLAIHTLRASDPDEKVLIRTDKPYARAIAAVQSVGGRVVNQFKYVDAIAAEVPKSGLPALKSVMGADMVSKDLEIDAPRSVNPFSKKGGPPVIEDARDVVADGAQVLDAMVSPEAYQVNNGISNVSALHAAGFRGQNVIVAVIDTGIRPGFPHITLDGSVIGCEDFVLDALGCSNFANAGHGTFVAGMISANVIFTFSAASALRQAVLAECPACFSNPPTNTMIPMIGSAPSSSIYALRIFGPTGGAPTSRVIAAIERVIDLRELANAGNPAGRNIRVVNMSLGGPTLFAGRDLMDQETDALLLHDIVPVVAAGNAGPSSLTMGSPASSTSAISVGAASLPHNERIYERLQFGPAIGNLYRPFLGNQMAFFSSRGPNADGRPDPDVVANGFASFGQGEGPATNVISFGFGTSFATPTVTGVAAVLRQRFPAASAVDVRNAIVVAGNPHVLNDDSDVLDQGFGYVDAGAAAARLAAGSVPNTIYPLTGVNSSVKVNIEQGTSLRVRDGVVSETFTGLKPGERAEVLYRIQPNTKQFVVVLSNVTPVLPPAEQNQLFGDDILFTVHSAKTSAIGEGDYKVFEFSPTGGTFVIDDPEQGILRVTVNGDWTNAGQISASVSMFSTTDPVPRMSDKSRITNGDTFVYPLVIPTGTTTADFRLEWDNNWGQYPTSDLDMILVRPNGTVDLSGAGLNSPEHVAVASPAPGQWLVIVAGAEVDAKDKYQLRIAVDGKIVK